jgi:signal transduction histidine kinase
MQIVEKKQDTVQVETQSPCLNVALVGGGSDCKALIQFLETDSLHHIHFHIIGVVGAHKHAPGLAYAREKGIYTTSDYRNLFDLENLHLIIELTGRDDVLREIVRSKPEHLKVMDHLSARLFWELIELQEEKARCEKRLVRANQFTFVGRMACSLTHEIRNPLVSIGGFADNIWKHLTCPRVSNQKPRLS